MATVDNILFPDPDFPIAVVPHRTSVAKKISVEASEIHEALEIKVFLEGCATLLVGNRSLVAEAGDVIVMNPYEFHATVECEAETSSYQLFMISLDFFAPFLEDETDLRTLFFSEKKALQNRITGNSELIGLLQAVVDEWEARAPMYRVRIRALMAEVLTVLIRNGMTDVQNAGDEQRMRQYRMIEPGLQKIRSGYGGELSLAMLADACCVNKYYFCRVFKEVMGCTPMQYLCQYRLHCADILLRNTNRSVADILGACGFLDESYFYRCYRKNFGITPHERRKNLIRKEK